MKKAIFKIETVSAFCPECDGYLMDDDGSTMINVSQFDKNIKFECEDCGKFFQIKNGAFK